ncbi:MAG: hypothetical protein ACLFQK_00430 [Fibrobacterota bacterium]
MKKILVEDISSGMVLAKPVVGGSGNILLNTGATLREQMASRLKSWGIPFVYVEGEEEDAGEEVKSGSKNTEDLRKDLETRFGENINDPMMKTVFNAVLNFLSSK